MTALLIVHFALIAGASIAALALFGLLSPWLAYCVAGAVIAGLWVAGYAHAFLGEPSDYQEPL